MELIETTLDLAALNPRTREAIENHCRETGLALPDNGFDALHYFLKWEGIIGYTAAIAGIIRASKGVQP